MGWKRKSLKTCLSFYFTREIRDFLRKSISHGCYGATTTESFRHFLNGLGKKSISHDPFYWIVKRCLTIEQSTL